MHNQTQNLYNTVKISISSEINRLFLATKIIDYELSYV